MHALVSGEVIFIDPVLAKGFAVVGRAAGNEVVPGRYPGQIGAILRVEAQAAFD